MLSTIIKSGYESWLRIKLSSVFNPAHENNSQIKLRC
jgi:hypothetical protein